MSVLSNPIKSSLILSDAREKEVVDLVIKRYQYVAETTGRREGTGYGLDSWMQKRWLATEQYQNKFDWRAAPDSLFAESNISMNICKRFVRVCASRAIDDLLGTDPFFGLAPIEWSDETVVKYLEKYLHWKIAQTPLKKALSEGILGAFIRGESAVKVTHVKRATPYKRLGSVLYDVTNNKPVVMSNGKMVIAFPNDKTPKFTQNSDGTWVLTEDDSMTVPPNGRWEFRQKLLEYEHVEYEGPDAAVIDYRDFFCGDTERDIHMSDFICHRYDMDIWTVGQLFERPDIASEETRQLILAAIRNANGTGKSEADLPNENRGERERDKDATPTMQLVEAWMKIDADGDHQPEQIMIVVDLVTRRAIWYDYTANVSETKNRPIHIIRVEPEPNRWHGCGIFQLLEDRQHFIDLQLNRSNFRNSTAGRMDFWDPAATEEGEAGMAPEFGTGRAYKLRSGKTAEDAFSFIQVPELDDAIKELRDLMLQVAQLELGIMTAGDGNIAGLPATDLATGIKSLERSGNILFKKMINDMAEGVAAIIKNVCILILARLDIAEVMRVLNLEEASAIQFRDAIELMKFDVRLLLTKSRSSETLSTNQQIKELVAEFWTYPPEIRVRLHDSFLNMLKALEDPSAETSLANPEIPTQIDIASTGNATPAAPAPTPPGRERAVRPPNKGPTIKVPDATAGTPKAPKTAEQKTNEEFEEAP